MYKEPKENRWQLRISFVTMPLRNSNDMGMFSVSKTEIIFFGEPC